MLSIVLKLNSLMLVVDRCARKWRAQGRRLCDWKFQLSKKAAASPDLRPFFMGPLHATGSMQQRESTQAGVL